MTTIILTIIGILLAAAAALMVVFYGGSAFEDGSVGASANTLQNVGSNVSSANSMFKMENGTAPANLTQLTDGRYLQSAPAIQGVGTNQTITANRYEITGVDAAVCAKVNDNLGIGPATSTPQSGAKMGCYDEPTNGETFFVTL